MTDTIAEPMIEVWDKEFADKSGRLNERKKISVPATLRMWSLLEGAVVPWTLSRELENDGGGNMHEVIIARHIYVLPSGVSLPPEIQRYSPNLSLPDLERVIADSQGASL